MDTTELMILIAKHLEEFYNRRMEKIQKLKLKQFLRRKNPYLFRAVGTEKASELVEDILRAYISSSDETIFGDAFFEPIAKIASKGVVSPSEGVDIAIDDEHRYLAVAIKSGPNWGNISQKKRQNQNFLALRSRLYKLHKRFDAMIGIAYGRKRSEPTKKWIHRDRSGQAFWTEITGDPDFYLKLVRLMKDEPQKHKERYRIAWGAAVNRFTSEFIQDFCFSDGRIDWEKLVRFVSEEKPSSSVGQKKKKMIER